LETKQLDTSYNHNNSQFKNGKKAQKIKVKRHKRESSLSKYINQAINEEESSSDLYSKNTIENIITEDCLQKFRSSKLLAAEKLKGVIEKVNVRMKWTGLNKVENHAIHGKYQEKVKQFEILVSKHIPKLLMN